MRQWKVGTTSLGILLILMGVIWIYSTITGISLVSTLFKWWPIILIMLGIEVLIYSLMPKKENTKVKFDGISILVIILIMIFMASAQIVNKGVAYGLNFLGKDISIPFKNSISYSKHYELEGNNREKIKINDAVGKIVIEKSENDKIIIDAVVNLKGNHKNSSLENEDNVINIDDKKVLSINHLSNFSKNNINFVSVDYIIKVPNNIPLEIDNKFGVTIIKGISADVKVDSSAGKVTVQEVKGNVSVDNKFGATECFDIVGNIKIDNSNGEINIDNISGKAELQGKFGAVKASNIKGDTTIDNANGSVNFSSNEVINYNLKVTSNFGKITVRLPKTQQGTFNGETKFGSIKNDFNLQVNTDENKNSLKGKIGDGKANITLINSNGSIDIIN